MALNIKDPATDARARAVSERVAYMLRLSDQARRLKESGDAPRGVGVDFDADGLPL